MPIQDYGLLPSIPITNVVTELYGDTPQKYPSSSVNMSKRNSIKKKKNIFLSIPLYEAVDLYGSPKEKK